MLKFPTIVKVFGDDVTGPGPHRPVHAPTTGSQRGSQRKPKLFCIVLLRGLQDQAGCHGLSSACPRAVPFAVYRKMLKFPTFLKDSGQAVRWSSGLIGRRPAGLFKKILNSHVFLRSPPCVSQLPRAASICCLQGVVALHRATEMIYFPEINGIFPEINGQFPTDELSFSRDN